MTDFTLHSDKESYNALNVLLNFLLCQVFEYILNIKMCFYFFNNY